MDFDQLTTDELHTLHEQQWQQYIEARQCYAWDAESEALKALSGTATELRRRHQLWIKLSDEALLKRYACGLAVAPLDTVMDEWQEEIQRRGLAFPQPWPDEDEAYFWWYDPEAE